MPRPGDKESPRFGDEALRNIDLVWIHGQTWHMSGIVYIMASRKNGTLYAGVTADPVTRIWEHRDKVHPKSFTARYNVTRLVWCREFDDIVEAIGFEKRLKRWRRHWKIQLIEKMNPEWEDLYFHFAT